jgi:hypothetical protein
MTLMDAKQYDEAPARRRRNLILAAVFAGLILAWVGYHFRSYPERRAVDKFFTALQQQNLETAFAIWYQDPQWKQHPAKYSRYGYGDFSQDWGPAGEWGIIKSHSVDCSYATGSGVIVQVTINQRTEHAYVWVDKSDKSVHFSPSEIDCGNWWGWFSE